MANSVRIRWSIAIGLIVASTVGAWDAYLLFSRTSAMAPIGPWRLAVSLLLQLLGVFGASSLVLPATARVRKAQGAIFRASPLFVAVFGLVLGSGLAVGLCITATANAGA